MANEDDDVYKSLIKIFRFQGDSGGPLVCKNTGDPNEKENGVLVGVVSGHIRERGSFFSRVSKYYDFVTDDPALDSFSNIPSYTSLHSSSPSYSLDTFNSITIVIIYNIFLF